MSLRLPSRIPPFLPRFLALALLPLTHSGGNSDVSLKQGRVERSLVFNRKVPGVGDPSRLAGVCIKVVAGNILDKVCQNSDQDQQ